MAGNLMTAKEVQQRLRSVGDPTVAASSARFFKKEHADKDVFVGIRVPTLRQLAIECSWQGGSGSLSQGLVLKNMAQQGRLPCCSTPQDVELFFKLHRTLMFFVNQRLKVIPDKLATPEEFAALSPEVRLKVRDALLANTRSDPVLCR